MFDDIQTLTEHDFREALKQLPNDRGMQLMDKDRRGFIKMRNLWPDRMHELAADRTKFHVVCMSMREISPPFWTYLEATYFPEGTKENDDLQIAFYRWQDILFDFVTIPVCRVDACYAAASHSNCRLADGVPTTVEPRESGPRNHGAFRAVDFPPDIKMMRFPLDSRRVFTLEPLHSKRGPVLAGIVSAPPAPEVPKPTVIDELIRKFRRA